MTRLEEIQRGVDRCQFRLPDVRLLLAVAKAAHEFILLRSSNVLYSPELSVLITAQQELEGIDFNKLRVVCPSCDGGGRNIGDLRGRCDTCGGPGYVLRSPAEEPDAQQPH